MATGTSVSQQQPLPQALNPVSALDLLHEERSRDTRSFVTETGIKSVDAQFPKMFRGARVIGVGRVSDDEGFNLPIQLVTTFLLDNFIAQSKTTRRVFTLASPNKNSITSIHSLLQQRLGLLPPSPRQSLEERCFTLLDEVRLLQYLDFPGLAESLQEVADSLFDSAGTSRQSILLVQGLSTLLSAALRRSGMVQTCAILSTTLRNIKQLARTNPDLLVLIEIDLTVQVPNGASDQGGVLASAFSSARGEVMRVIPVGNVGELIESEMDVVVCVHDGFGKTKQDGRDGTKEGRGTRTTIVELVKDGAGRSFGEWSLWVQ